MSSQGRVVTADWWDVYHFDSNDARVICPDCDELSPEFENIWDAIQWIDQHGGECKA